eukprot:COSAG02_NODE_60848_length_270_cov_0.602339_1_plen_25_part_10
MQAEADAGTVAEDVEPGREKMERVL